ncbi:MAG: hypothetical protein ACLQVK_08120 [Acidimicrobiales bacterium]
MIATIRGLPLDLLATGDRARVQDAANGNERRRTKKSLSGGRLELVVNADELRMQTPQ